MAEKFCWVELLTTDIDAAQAFYSEVIGWTCAAPGHAERDYRLFFQDGNAAAGLMLLPDEARAQGARPSWFGYITSRDVEADVAAIVAAGGKLYRPTETSARRSAASRWSPIRRARLSRCGRTSAASRRRTCRRCPSVMSAGASFTPTMSRRPLPSTRRSSAGPRPRRSIWVRSASISCSRPESTRSAAC